MTVLDVIILSNASSKELENLTKKSLSTLMKSELDSQILLNPIVIEQNPEVTYSVTTVHKTEPFNYNRFLNYGIEITKSDYIAMCNNDLLYKKDWASNILAVMGMNNLYSASPIDPFNQGRNEVIFKKELEEGYIIGRQFNGWCHVVHRRLFNIIGRLNEDCDFWYSDNEAIRQLQEHKVKHAIVPSSHVVHLGAKTWKTLPIEKQREITVEQRKKYIGV